MVRTKKPVSTAYEVRCQDLFNIHDNSEDSSSESVKRGNNDWKFFFCDQHAEKTSRTRLIPEDDLKLSKRRDYLQFNEQPRKEIKVQKQKMRSRSHSPHSFLYMGTPLLKYCRRKKGSHWRHFEVDTELDYLVWYSPSKSTTKTRIALVDINEVVMGQKSPGFQKVPRRSLVHQSFSIIYQGKKWLDLISMNQKDALMWIHSLSNLLTNIRDGDKWCPLNKIALPKRQEKSKIAFFPAGDGSTWQNYVNNLHRCQCQIIDLLKKSEELRNFPNISTMRNRLEKLSDILNRMAMDSETSKWLDISKKNELRSFRVEIGTLRYKVSVLLREKASEGFFGKSMKMNNHETFTAGDNRSFIIRKLTRSKRNKDRQRALVSPKCYRYISSDKKREIRDIILEDRVLRKKTSTETVSRLCSTYAFSRIDAESIVRYISD